MKFSTFILAASATSYASAKLSRCGTEDPPARLKFALDETAFRYARHRNGTTWTVDTYAHVVTSTEKDGVYTQTMIDDQVCLASQPQLIEPNTNRAAKRSPS